MQKEEPKEDRRATGSDEARMLEVLRTYIASLGGELEAGWQCEVRKRAAGGGTRADAYYTSPGGVRFRCGPLIILPVPVA